MIYGIAPFMPPELVAILMEMGHGDELVIGDRNFPASTLARRLVRCDGVNGPAMLEEVLRLIPLDYVTDYDIMLMKPDGEPPVWAEYRRIVEQAQKNGPARLMDLPKPEFYARSREAFAVVITGESAAFGNVIVRKGVLK